MFSREHESKSLLLNAAAKFKEEGIKIQIQFSIGEPQNCSNLQ
jgi:hypothetical protein